jgi:hypothetical protein
MIGKMTNILVAFVAIAVCALLTSSPTAFAASSHHKHSSNITPSTTPTQPTQHTPRCVDIQSATGGLLGVLMAGPLYSGYDEADSDVSKYHSNKTHIYSSLNAFNEPNQYAQSARIDCGVNDVHGEFAQGYNNYFGMPLNQTKLHAVTGITYNDCNTAAGVSISSCLPVTIKITFDNGTTAAILGEFPGQTSADFIAQGLQK